MSSIEGRAILFCEGALGTTNGKTAHGLLRRSERYEILSVVDSTNQGEMTSHLLRGCRFDVPVLASVQEAVLRAKAESAGVTHLIVGLAPDGGKLPPDARREILSAVSLGLSVISGLHDFLSDDEELVALAENRGVSLVDVRKMPAAEDRHFFSGKIEAVTTPRIAVLGTDSAVGKRTTAWMLVDAYRKAGFKAELVGTGQTARIQGAKFGVVFDALINDFVSGEIEHAVFSAWEAERPDVIIVEGQGSLMNPAYPGGLEILAASRPACIVLQHAPARKEYDGFPGYPLHPLPRQIQALELISDRKVVAVTVNSELLDVDEIEAACRSVTKETGLVAVDPLRSGVDAVVAAAAPYIGLGGVAGAGRIAASGAP